MMCNNDKSKFLAHTIDACTLSAGHPETLRRRNQRVDIPFTPIFALVVIAICVGFSLLK